MIDLDSSDQGGAYKLAVLDARNKLKGKPLQKVAETWVAVRKERDAVSDRRATLTAWDDVIRMEVIPTQMEKEGVEIVQYAGVGKITTQAEVFVSVPASNRDKLYAWLRKNRMGALITETVNSSTLKAWVKGRMADGKSLPSDLMKVTPATMAKLTAEKAE